MAQEMHLHLHNCIPRILLLGGWSCLMNAQRTICLLPPEKAKLDANKEKSNVPLHDTIGHREAFSHNLQSDIFMLSWPLCINYTS